MESREISDRQPPPTAATIITTTTTTTTTTISILRKSNQHESYLIIGEGVTIMSEVVGLTVTP